MCVKGVCYHVEFLFCEKLWTLQELCDVIIKIVIIMIIIVVYCDVIYGKPQIRLVWWDNNLEDTFSKGSSTTHAVIVYFCINLSSCSHTSGRACKGNATITAFFMPREAVWNHTQGWLKAYHRRRALGQAFSEEEPEYFPLSALSPKDYHMYLEYDYRFIEYVSVAAWLARWCAAVLLLRVFDGFGSPFLIYTGTVQNPEVPN